MKRRLPGSFIKQQAPEKQERKAKRQERQPKRKSLREPEKDQANQQQQGSKSNRASGQKRQTRKELPKASPAQQGPRRLTGAEVLGATVSDLMQEVADFFEQRDGMALAPSLIPAAKVQIWHGTSQIAHGAQSLLLADTQPITESLPELLNLQQKAAGLHASAHPAPPLRDIQVRLVAPASSAEPLGDAGKQTGTATERIPDDAMLAMRSPEQASARQQPVAGNVEPANIAAAETNLRSISGPAPDLPPQDSLLAKLLAGDDDWDVTDQAGAADQPASMEVPAESEPAPPSAAVTDDLQHILAEHQSAALAAASLTASRDQPARISLRERMSGMKRK